MKKLTVVILSAVLLAALAGCAQQSAQIAPVGFDAAKAAALEAAGVAAEDADFEEASLKEYKGHQYYEIEFDAKGREYDYYIEALTGTVITPEMAAEVLGGNIQIPVNENTEQPQQNEAKPAQEKADVPKDEAKPAENKAEEPKSEAQAPKAEKAEEPKSDNKTDSQLIGESKAKSIALSHAGKKEADVKFVRCELDRDDGRVVYEVEFYGGDFVEYDYDIDAYSGNVVSFDYDAEGYRPEEAKPTEKPAEKPSENKTDALISESKAKEIALSQVPGAKETDIREFEVDRDDGRIEYEGKIVYNELEYEFEIDGYSGAIRNWEVESVYDD
ncbi:MAG: PepSY domain-containing protein [Oscillospiraceae bacterium]|nr:PepSY domain-containing protein [Oscillospiraceae bacterium]